MALQEEQKNVKKTCSKRSSLESALLISLAKGFLQTRNHYCLLGSKEGMVFCVNQLFSAVQTCHANSHRFFSLFYFLQLFFSVFVF